MPLNLAAMEAWTLHNMQGDGPPQSLLDGALRPKDDEDAAEMMQEFTGLRTGMYVLVGNRSFVIHHPFPRRFGHAFPGGLVSNAFAHQSHLHTPRLVLNLAGHLRLCTVITVVNTVPLR